MLISVIVPYGISVLVGLVLGYKGHTYIAAEQTKVKTEEAALKATAAAVKKAV